MTKGLFFLVALCAACTSTAVAATYSITVEEGTGASVKRPEKCNADINGGGGDYVEAGVTYKGKCQGAGSAPKIEKMGEARYLKFATDPSYQGTTKTRSELALTKKWFPFKEPVYIGLKIRVPAKMAHTDKFFYMMQLWQCSPAGPIAGIRMSRGYSHRVNFMTRSDSRAASMATYDLSPDTWTSFVIKAIVDPTGGLGSFVVWNDPEVKPTVYRGPYGYKKKGICGDEKAPPQRFRIKFGIYKGYENSKAYEVDYDDIRIGKSFDIVSPWKNSE